MLSNQLAPPDFALLREPLSTATLCLLSTFSRALAWIAPRFTCEDVWFGRNLMALCVSNSLRVQPCIITLPLGSSRRIRSVLRKSAHLRYRLRIRTHTRALSTAKDRSRFAFSSYPRTVCPSFLLSPPTGAANPPATYSTCKYTTVHRMR